MQHDIDITLIDKFLRGRLTEEENLLFEQKKSDPEFVKKMELHQMSIEAIELGSRDLFKEKVRNEESRIRKNTKIRILKRVSIAAIFILGAFFVKNALDNPSGLSQEQAIYALFEPYPNQNVSINRGSDEQNSREKALSFYDAGDFTKAIEFLQSISNSNALDTLYLACSFIGIQNNEQAISLLDKVTINVTTVNSVLWYKALVYSVSNNKSEAIPILNKIIDSNDPIYKDDAEELLEILRK